MVDSQFVFGSPPWQGILNDNIKNVSNGHFREYDYDLIFSFWCSYYFTVPFRRCVPSTEKNAEVPGSPVHDQLPETEIFVIDNYFESHDLYPDIRELLQEPRVFLVGPPSTDRTDSLCHVGRKWIAEGHVVYLINLRSSGHPATTRLQQLLQQRDGNNSRTSQAHATVIPLLCDIKDDKKINNNINKLVQCSKEKILCALVDDLAPESR